jgi:hypothetical protein
VSETPDTPTQPVDPIDEEAAEIDARSPEAPEMIAELEEHAAALGRPAEGTRPSPDPYVEPDNSTVDDWFGQSVDRDLELATELVEATGDERAAEEPFDALARGASEQARRHEGRRADGPMQATDRPDR